MAKSILVVTTVIFGAFKYGKKNDDSFQAVRRLGCLSRALYWFMKGVLFQFQDSLFQLVHHVM